MPPMRYERRTTIPGATARELFDWHARPGAFERLAPPWEAVEVREQPAGLVEGGRVVLRVPAGPAKMEWVAELSDIEPGRRFVDTQVRGPFAAWRHEHGFVEAEGGAAMDDRIEFRLPMQGVAKPLAGGFVRGKLERMFQYRHDTLAADLAAHRRLEAKPMRIAITGASGLVGTALTHFLATGGHTVLPIVRRKSPSGILWDPAKGFPDGTEQLEGLDAVIHLAGENVAGGRWTPSRKAAIRDSRIQGTTTLAKALASLDRKPSVVVSASAVGIYGDRGADWVDEAAPHGNDFLAEVGKRWESCMDPARDAGIRVVHPRIGIVLSPAGGALKKMLPAFKAGLGGRLGSGQQYMSWIGIDDAINGIAHALATESIAGPMNLCAPAPATNAEFTKALAKVLRRPVGPPVPPFALRMLYGELADAALLSGVRAKPAVLESTGYQFRHPGLEDALRHVLGRK